MNMTNLQLYIAVGVPMLVIVTSLILNLVTVSGIRENIRELREDIREIRNDIKLMTGKIVDIDNRVTRIEEKLNI